MLRTMCKSKIHRVTVTEANLDYVGSITIDKTLMDAADILPHERIQIVNLNSGVRLETYVMEGTPGSGTICMNGGAARYAEVGDILILISYALLEEDKALTYKPKVIFVDAQNRIVDTSTAPLR